MQKTWINDELSKIGWRQIHQAMLKASSIMLLLCMGHAHAATSLADQPILASVSTTGNVALTLSVEFPTALGSAYTGSYSTAQEFLGYFDANKCYTYSTTTSTNLANAIKNTGVDSTGTTTLTQGTNDPNWSVLLNLTGTDINNVTTAGTGSGSGYIGSTSAVAAGSYTYQTTFTIPYGTDPSKVSITFDLWANSLTNILVNGVATGITSNTTSSTSATVTIPAGSYPLVTGVNILGLVVANSATNTTTTYAASGSGSNKNCPSGGALTSSGSSTCAKTNSPTLKVRIDNMTVTETPGNGNYFQPAAKATSHACSGYWSGNFLNWALMQTIDPFRSALTGGYRSIDTAFTTILEKAWASGQGGTVVDSSIVNNSALIKQSTPYNNLSSIYIRIAGLGNQLKFTGTANNFGATTIADTAIPTTIDSSKLYAMYARVKVCDANTAMKATGIESNCTAYGSYYKPEGLIQANAKKLNFAAFGYLNDSSDNPQRDGAVLRARMAALGPTATNPEWNGSTGVFYTNPDTTDATSSSVTNSGVINYLNKFGLTSLTYKSYDPVGELYYAAVRYFKYKSTQGGGNVSSYSSNLTTALKDGFPVITTWDDPIQNSCQSNFIIGIGDTNSWGDADLPGSTIYSTSGKEPSPRPTEITGDTSVDVKVATNKVGQLEGINNLGLGNLGEIFLPWCCGNSSTFFMAGLAYDSHTKDIRPDITGTQTINTYWLDVLESGDRKDFSKTGMRNQFWLATKYGGFTVPDSYSPYATNAIAPIASQWDADSDGDPDNYFRANDPASMISGLNSAFNSIVSKISGSSIGFATSAPSIDNGDITYATSYNSSGWTGDVTANTLSLSSAGTITSTFAWSASDKLEAQSAGTGWDSGRYIATSTCSGGSSGTQTCTGVPFRLGSLNTIQQLQIAVLPTNQQNMLNFLRGDRSKEGTLYRNRSKILGDIINSKLVAVGAPSEGYSDSFNPGYAAFAATYQNRKTVTYVGANDGMLHAFDGSGTGGNELFAYVPNAVINGPNSTPTVDGLAALSNVAFLHHYYVDATPQVVDVNFGGGTTDWHTLLISGLGKGGKSYFALDVTNPDNLSSEANLASAVKWEFTHSNMGYSYDIPLVIKIAANSWLAKKTSTPSVDQWVIVLPSGYNNSDGKGYLFFVKPSDGSLIAKISVNDGAQSSGTDAGLAHVNAFIANASSGLADAVYAGDLLGNLWRLDLTGGSDNTPLKFAQLKGADGTAQPITTSPIIEVDSSTNKRYVFVGTGRLLDTSDLTSTQKQSFYAINDGTSSKFYTSTTLPTTSTGQISFPILRSNLVNDSSSILTGVTASATQPMGYYIDLGLNATEPYFINTEMASGNGVISFIANTVDSSNVCKLTATNLTYALSYGPGKSLLSSGGNTVSSISGTGLGTSLTFFQKTYTDASGKIVKVNQIATCDSNGNCNILTPQTSSAKPFTLLNWRELPTAE